MGNGYISHPSRTALATKPPKTMPPNRSCSRGSSRSSIANTSATRKENTTRRSRWLFITPLLPAQRDVPRVGHDQQVEQPRHDQERVAVLVRGGYHGARARGEAARQEVRHANPHVSDGRQGDQRLADFERKQSALQQQPDRKHQGQRDQEHHALGAPPEP